MAVTESGITDASLSPHTARGAPPSAEPLRLQPSLLWIGVPVEEHAGLLVLLGHDGDASASDHEPDGWPLSLSGRLGVRIYDSRV
jgi:hypothetical protein